MKSYCKNLKIKLNRTLFCKILNKKIQFKNCSNCKYKEYKSNNHQIKKRTYKLAKLERNRFSIITDDLEHCIICGKSKDNLHEVFSGRNKLNSIKYGIVIPICLKHHSEIHKNKNLQDIYHIIGQKTFMKHYNKTIDEFRDIFKKNYL